LQSLKIHGMITIMRYPKDHNDAVRARIVSSAAAALRRDGLDGVSIPALMKSVGLTHGGFYTHFESRDQLVAEAVAAASACSAAAVFAQETALSQSLQRYLSPQHLACPQDGCVVAALGTDGARQLQPVRGAFAKAARGLLALVEKKLHPAKRAGAPSDEALRLTATMVGAVVLGRLVDDPGLAGRILRAARDSAPA
jgi:TetR/AcrR family transcriptional regulator, transcriptional repressor for nem operon